MSNFDLLSLDLCTDMQTSVQGRDLSTDVHTSVHGVCPISLQLAGEKVGAFDLFPGGAGGNGAPWSSSLWRG